MIRLRRGQLFPVGKAGADADGLEARLLAGGDVERGVADDIDIRAGNWFSRELPRPRDGLAQESMAMERVRTVSPELEVRVEPGRLKFDARSLFHIAGAEP